MFTLADSVRGGAGDSSTTACAIARDCGILTRDDQPVLGLPDSLNHLAASRAGGDGPRAAGDGLSSSSQEAERSSLDQERINSGSRASTSGRNSTSVNGAFTSVLPWLLVNRAL